MIRMRQHTNGYARAFSQYLIFSLLASWASAIFCGCGCAAPQPVLDLGEEAQSLATVNGMLVGVGRDVRMWNWANMHTPPRVVPTDGTRFAGVTRSGTVLLALEDAVTRLVTTRVGDERRTDMWQDTRMWTWHGLRATANGRHVAVWLYECTSGFPLNPGYPRTRVGVIREDAQAPEWIETLEYASSGPTVWDAAVSEDARYLAVVGSSNGGWIRIVDTDTRRMVWESKPEMSTAFRGVAISPDSRAVYAACGAMGEVYVFDLVTGKVLGKWSIHPDHYEYGQNITSLAVSGDGRLVGCGTGPHGEVFVWNAADGKRVAAFATGQGTTQGLAFSPDGRRLATCGVAGRTTRIWSVAAAQPGE
jgi:WD40 repeat protein